MGMTRTILLLTVALLWTHAGRAAQPPQIINFAPPPVIRPEPQTLTSFDPGSVEVRWLDDRWQLLAGGVLFKDLGRRPADARQALEIIRALGLNQHGTVGTPQPIMEYWLANGQAPQALGTSRQLLPIDLDSLKVEQLEGQWCVHDARRLLFAFGAHEDEAKAAVDVIRRYGFTQVGYVGAPVPVMMYFLGGPAGLGGGRMAGPAPLASRRVSHDKKAPVKLTDLRPQPLPSGVDRRELVRLAGPITLATARQLSSVAPLALDLPGLGDRVRFDPRELVVRCEDGDWRLCSGAYVLARFGPGQAEALQAREALRQYGCNEHCRVGRPQPVFSFFLANGEAPRGRLFGLTGTDFRPETLTVRRDGADWYVCADGRTLLRAGAKEEDANKLLELIRRYKFDALLQVGGEASGMSILVRIR
jgi:hypothetical protein